MLEEILVKSFTQHLYALLDEKQLPAKLLRLTIILVPKGWVRDICGGYRLASLTSIVMDTLESVLREGIVDHPEAENLMMVQQMASGINVLVCPNRLAFGQNNR